MSNPRDLAAHLRYLSDIGVQGISRDVAWRTRAEPLRQGGAPGAHAGEQEPDVRDRVERGPGGPGQETQHEARNSGSTRSLDVIATADLMSPADRLRQIRDDIGECTRCKLHGGRTNVVFGAGDPASRLMFVGEGPGAEEDQQGEPFVGRAGQLLTQIIKAMGFAREQVYIANVVKCRPPGNRNPEPDEVAACSPFLHAQIAAIRPRVIVALGKFAAQTLLQTETPISRLRGQFHPMGDIAVMPTFHPSYLLRNPSAKREVWEDMKQVMKLLADAPER